MQPNRLERHWPYIVAQLAQRYPLVPRALWDATAYQHDRIVRLVRDTYAPGRSEITVEAEVRDGVNQWVAEAEEREDAYGS